jgi:energy-coupling factor transporter ATP-binding protein EcfA2
MMSTESPVSDSLVAHKVSYSWPGSDTGMMALNSFSGIFSFGTCHILCGPSGAGKTTLAWLLSGLIQPFSGSICRGTPSAEGSISNVAHVFQFPEQLFIEDSVRAEFGAVVGEGRRRESMDIVRAIGIDVEAISDLHPFQLSGGYSRLVAIAMQVARDPEILIVDEPTVGLDWRFQKTLAKLLKDWITPSRLLICVTHDLLFMRRLGGTAWALKAGGLAWEGETATLLANDKLLRACSLRV